MNTIDDLNAVLRQAQETFRALGLGVVKPLDCTEETTALLKASLQVRTHAARCLPDLHRALLKAAKDRAVEVDMSVTEARKFLRAVR